MMEWFGLLCDGSMRKIGMRGRWSCKLQMVISLKMFPHSNNGMISVDDHGTHAAPLSLLLILKNGSLNLDSPVQGPSSSSKTGFSEFGTQKMIFISIREATHCMESRIGPQCSPIKSARGLLISTLDLPEIPRNVYRRIMHSLEKSMLDFSNLVRPQFAHRCSVTLSISTPPVVPYCV